MKKALLLLIFIFSYLNSFAQWQQCNNGFYGLPVADMLIKDNIMLAGNSQGVFTSADQGESWSLPANEIKGHYVKRFAVKDNLIFAGTDNGIFLSSDNGTSWSEISSGINNKNISLLYVYDNVIYAGTYKYNINGNSSCALYKTTDNGTTWQFAQNGLPGGNSYVTALAGLGNNTLLAGTFDNGLFRSKDNGTTWFPLNNAPAGKLINCMAVTDNRVFAGTADSGIYVSSDNGNNWTKSNTGLPKAFSPISFSHQGNNLYACLGYNGIYLSTDMGENWKCITDSLQRFLLNSRVIPVGDNLFSISSCGVYKSTDKGRNWTSKNSGLDKPTVYGFRVQGNDIYTCYSGQLFNSSDFGLSWSPIFNNPYMQSTSKFVVSGSNIFAEPGSTSVGIYISTDKGKTWDYSPRTPIVYISGFEALGNKLFITCFYDTNSSRNGIFVSDDNAKSWSALASQPPDTNATCMAVSGSNLYAGTFYGNLFVSSDSGSTWSPFNKPPDIYPKVNYVSRIITDGNTFFVVKNGKNYLSIDNGSSWTLLNNKFSDSTIRDFAISGSYLFAATAGDGVFMSPDLGTSWFPVNKGLTGKFVGYLAVAGNYLFAGTYTDTNTGSMADGVFRADIASLLTGVEESTEIQSNLRLFPNPVTDRLAIQRSSVSPATLIITDNLGNEVYKSNISYGDLQLNISLAGQSSGVYFLRLISNDGSVETARFVKY